jgi:hypothetical protein
MVQTKAQSSTNQQPPHRRLLLNIPDADLRRIQADILDRAKAHAEMLQRQLIVDNPPATETVAR